MQQAARPSTYYHSTATEPFPQAPQLTHSTKADVCVIGGGYTGLTTALHLARRGASVTLLEASHLGCGASGRNGGQVHNGFRHDSHWFESLLGADFALAEAHKLYTCHDRRCEVEMEQVHPADAGKNA